MEGRPFRRLQVPSALEVVGFLRSIGHNKLFSAAAAGGSRTKSSPPSQLEGEYANVTKRGDLRLRACCMGCAPMFLSSGFRGGFQFQLPTVQEDVRPIRQGAVPLTGFPRGFL
ncbi:hypothetical protein THAOC_30675, partial [Thalassiosira oceanica]